MKASLRNNLTKGSWHSEEIVFLDEIFCEDCEIPVSPGAEYCGKCGHEFTFTKMIKAMATQARLRSENERNRKYLPPKLYI